MRQNREPRYQRPGFQAKPDPRIKKALTTTRPTHPATFQPVSPSTDDGQAFLERAPGLRYSIATLPIGTPSPSLSWPSAQIHVKSSSLPHSLIQRKHIASGETSTIGDTAGEERGQSLKWRTHISANLPPHTLHPRSRSEPYSFPALSALIYQARTEDARALDAPIRERLKHHLGHDLTRVQVHKGPASALSAAALNARAFTLGRDIYLGAQAHTLNSSERAQLLAHEAVHTVQQGGQSIIPQGNLAINHPNDATENEADQIATSVMRPASQSPSRSLALRDQLRAGHLSDDAEQRSSRSLALRDQMRSAPLTQGVLMRTPTPLIQRDLNANIPLKNGNGTFDLAFKSYSKRRKQPDKTMKPETGLAGKITFTPSATSPQGTNIKLLQVSRLTIKGGAQEYTWKGDEAQREQAKTTQDLTTGVEGGYFVDTSYKPYTPRQQATDPAISPYYIDLAKGGTQGGQAGYHDNTQNPAIKDATLEDEPSIEVPGYFYYETTAKDVNTGTVYGGVLWSFEVSQVAGFTHGVLDHNKAKVQHETAKVLDTPTKTFNAAVTKFDEYFRNPGSVNAP